jgi:hypothetical protein
LDTVLIAAADHVATTVQCYMTGDGVERQDQQLAVAAA